jgi:hypothetical protein
MKRAFAVLAAIVALPASGALAADAAAIDWSKIPASTVALFYPGQSTYEWLRGSGHPKGLKQVEEGRACTSCHEDDEKDIGNKHVKGSAIEPTPVKGKAGAVDLKVQAAYDDKNAYFRFQWKTQNPYAGDEHGYLRFDGKEWKVYGLPKLDKEVQDGKQPGISEDRITMMIDDGKVPMFAKQGCWLTCHNGSPGTSSAATGEEIAANALMKAGHQSEVRKYLPATRTDPADWKTGKSADEIAKLKSEGGFVDFIPWYAHRSNPVGMAGDGYVLEYRLADAGKETFSENEDAATHQPKFMWDEKKAGYRSITDDQLHKAQHVLIKEQNAAAFDPKAGWKAGDMVPAYVLSAAGASGSAADNKATGTWKDGEWTVVITRPLGLTNDDDKALKAGSTYSVGFAVHDDNIAGRGHFVSFVRTIGFGADGKIKAVKLP